MFQGSAHIVSHVPHFCREDCHIEIKVKAIQITNGLQFNMQTMLSRARIILTKISKISQGRGGYY